MPQVKIGLVQMCCEKGAIAPNIAQMESYIQQAIEEEADFLCFPEMNITGYVNPALFPQACLDMYGKEVTHLASLTVDTKLVVIAGLIEPKLDGGKPYITQIALGQGRRFGKYRKITVVAEETEWFSPCSSVPHFTHPVSKIPFGLAICADIDNPQIFKAHAAMGIKLVFEAAAPGLYGEQQTRNWQTGFEWWRGECYTKLARYALENKIYIAVATQAGRTVDEDFPGGGYVFAPDGNCIAATSDWSPGILWATFSI